MSSNLVEGIFFDKLALVPTNNLDLVIFIKFKMHGLLGIRNPIVLLSLLNTYLDNPWFAFNFRIRVSFPGQNKFWSILACGVICEILETILQSLVNTGRDFPNGLSLIANNLKTDLSIVGSQPIPKTVSVG